MLNTAVQALSIAYLRAKNDVNVSLEAEKSILKC